MGEAENCIYNKFPNDTDTSALEAYVPALMSAVLTALATCIGYALSIAPARTVARILFHSLHMVI